MFSYMHVMEMFWPWPILNKNVLNVQIKLTQLLVFIAFVTF